MKLRIKFRKFGSVRFLGHLDVMRYFQKAIRRAEIDIAYTTGYSPHQIMSFASPLSVGMESNGEYLDITVHSATSSVDMRKRLNEVGVIGIEVVSVRELPEDAPNAMASIAAAEYTVRFREGRELQFDYRKALTEFNQKEQILITKTTKKSERVVDLKPGIFELTASDDCIHMIVDASSAGNIKPSLVIDAFMSEQGISLPDNSLLITREELYTYLDSKLCPLEAVGREMVG